MVQKNGSGKGKIPQNYGNNVNYGLTSHKNLRVLIAYVIKYILDENYNSTTNLDELKGLITIIASTSDKEVK